MTVLSIYDDVNPHVVLFKTNDFKQIQDKLDAIAILLRRWQTKDEVSAGSENDEILAAYRVEIEQLVTEGGYQSWDVVSMGPNHPEKSAFRQKFLNEHTHSEDEVRFFVRGCGLFVMHVEHKVYSLLCEKNDLINVPAGTKHWFDMGPNPDFTAIRLFDNPEGWVANFTGNEIANRFPKMES